MLQCTLVSGVLHRKAWAKTSSTSKSDLLKPLKLLQIWLSYWLPLEIPASSPGISTYRIFRAQVLRNTFFLPETLKSFSLADNAEVNGKTAWLSTRQFNRSPSPLLIPAGSFTCCWLSIWPPCLDFKQAGAEELQSSLPFSWLSCSSIMLLQ